MAKGPQAEYTNLVGYFKHLVWLTGGSVTVMVAIAGFLFYSSLKDAREDAKQTAIRVVSSESKAAVEKAFEDKNINAQIQKVAQDKISAITDKMIEQQITSKLQPLQRRHTCIAALLGVDQLLVVANKMDLVGWDRAAYDHVRDEMHALAARLSITSCTVVPISALHGDNVVDHSDAAPWYTGPTVLEALEAAPAGAWSAVHGAHRGTGARLPVQWVLRHGTRRSYAGIVGGAPLRPGDEVVVLPDGRRSRITSVTTYDGPLEEAPVGMSVSVDLADDVDVSRAAISSRRPTSPRPSRATSRRRCAGSGHGRFGWVTASA